MRAEDTMVHKNRCVGRSIVGFQIVRSLMTGELIGRKFSRGVKYTRERKKIVGEVGDGRQAQARCLKSRLEREDQRIDQGGGYGRSGLVSS